MSTLVVVEEILREVKRPVSVREIVEFAGERLPTKSKTPDTVVARDLSMDIKRKGEDSLFIRTAPGRYTMREFVVGTQLSSTIEHVPGTSAITSVAISEPRAPIRRAPTSDETSHPAVQEG